MPPQKNTLPNIFIIGSFGTGKTTIGREVARLLHRKFYDTDCMLEKKLGVDISWALDIEGRGKLFAREHKLLKKLIAFPNIVLSTGGMTILFEENRKLLQENGIIIALSSTLKTQLHRTRYSKNRRPLIRGKDQQETRERLDAFKQKFDALYVEIAHKTFSTSKDNTKQTARNIKAFLDNWTQTI
jgi:shikimate kinase